jgi:hypothetical protein
VQRAGGSEHGTVVVTRVVQVGSIMTHPNITGQFTVGRSETVVVVHEIGCGGGRGGGGTRVHTEEYHQKLLVQALEKQRYMYNYPSVKF